jgi:hypothetical protein
LQELLEVVDDPFTNALAPGQAQAIATETNTININYIPGDGKTNPGFVLGGYSVSGNVTGNTVNLISGESNGNDYKGEIYGGVSKSGQVTGNKVNISGGTAKTNVFGGLSNSGWVMPSNRTTKRG